MIQNKLLVWGVIAGTLPLICWQAGFTAWAFGLTTGQAIGWMSFFWIGHSLHQSLAKAQSTIHRSWWMQSLLRYGVIAVILAWVLKGTQVSWPAIVAGYSMIQLPAAVLRAVAETTRLTRKG